MAVQVFVERFSQYHQADARRAVSAQGSHAEALVVAKARVDAALLGLWHHSMSGQELYSRWSRFAEDVTIEPETGQPTFSARAYAMMRVQKITGQVCV